MMKSDARMLAMFAGWIMAFCGVRRRSWAGTMIAMLGLSVAQAALTIGEGEPAFVQEHLGSRRFVGTVEE
jgi:hypothetical protein